MNYSKLFLFAIVLTILSSCEREEADDTPAKSSKKAITEFVISGTEGSIDENAKTILLLLNEDLGALSPTITVSSLATVSPASGATQDFTNPVTYTVTAEDETSVDYTVIVQSSIQEFTFDGKKYEIVKEKSTWLEAVTFAVSRGGYLAEINNAEEQAAIFKTLTDSDIDLSSTVSADGGNASYVWIGGNDIATEGNWIWDGNYDESGPQFWMGTQSGTVVDGLYNNWGNEPDDFGSGQDGLSLAISDWPLGVAGQWNDVDLSNRLYFVVEFE